MIKKDEGTIRGRRVGSSDVLPVRLVSTWVRNAFDEHTSINRERVREKKQSE